MRQYILLTAYPGIPVGTVFTEDGENYRNVPLNAWFAKSVVEGSPVIFGLVV